MKKIIAILFMLILLFNLWGYRLVVNSLQQQADTKLEAQLDKNEYDESQLVEIKIPMNLPYQQRYTEFERHYGEIEINGKSYTYVKRKIEGDVVILKCIANLPKDELKAIRNDLAKANGNADMDHSGKQTPIKSFEKKQLGDYDNYFMPQPGIASLQLSASNNNGSISALPAGTATVLHQPPRIG